MARAYFVGFNGALQEPYLEFAKQSKLIIQKYMVQVVDELFEQFDGDDEYFDEFDCTSVKFDHNTIYITNLTRDVKIKISNHNDTIRVFKDEDKIFRSYLVREKLFSKKVREFGFIEDENFRDLEYTISIIGQLAIDIKENKLSKIS